MSNLVIVESPTKAKTISKYLGKGYKVISSMGHVRDLPEDRLGVDLEKNFEPYFIIKNRKLVAELQKEAEKAGKIYLATDNDREGEAIAYDLYEVLNDKTVRKKKYLRVIFNEITKHVILKAMEEPQQLDLKKVEAQRARRILDRLVGYLISPLLSKSISGSKYEGLSAGRVQSVALRFICDREQEIKEFVPEEYWTIEARLKNSSEFIAKLKRYRGTKPKIANKDEAHGIKARLEKLAFIVKEVQEEEYFRKPPPPFITSTLQQAASSVLRFSPERTMRVAQQLYEGIELEEGLEGLITYMRTDSTRVAEEALGQLRDFIKEEYGEKYLSSQIRYFKNKKASQDAHEAIRPTSVSRTPEAVAKFLTKDQQKLYKLIWERFVATQMAQAVYQKKKVKIEAGDYLFGVSGSRLTFDGFLKVLKLGKLVDEGIELPDLKEGQRLSLIEVIATQCFTEPPARYTEAGLIKALEEQGIGRPSTYATIVSTIQERGYVQKEAGTLKPTLLGFIATDFLKEFFPETLETSFTAQMEEDLDKISEGELARLKVLQSFYKPLERQLTKVKEELKANSDAFSILADVTCEACGAPMEVRYWQGSRYLGCSRYPECKNTVDFPEDISYEYREKKVKLRENLKEQQEAQKRCPTCGAPMEIKQSRFGRFLGCTRYPQCRTTEPLSIGVPCPLCSSELIERYSTKRKRVFYGCSGYPECKFIINQKPIKVCTQCKEGVMVEGKESGTLICSNKKCRHQEQI